MGFINNKFYQADKVESRSVTLAVGNINALDINTIGYSQIEIHISGNSAFKLTAYKVMGGAVVSRIYNHDKKRVYGYFSPDTCASRRCILDVSDCEKVIFTGAPDTSTDTVTVKIKYSTAPFIESTGIHVLASATFAPVSGSAYVMLDSASTCDDIKFFAVTIKRTDGDGYGAVAGTVDSHFVLGNIVSGNKRISEFNTINFFKTDWQENIGEKVGILFTAAENSYGGTFVINLIGIN